jgi:class 3 adenylate cyclase
MRDHAPSLQSQPSDEFDLIGRVCPSRVDDRSFREWFDSAGRTGASPGVAARLYEPPPDRVVQSLTAAQERIDVPTLVLRRPGNLMGSPGPPDPVASAIPHGSRVDLPGSDYHWLGEDVDSLLAEVSRFVTGEPRLPTPQRELCAVVFTDLVGSTEHVAARGDARWKAVIDRHDQSISQEVARYGGIVVQTTGDGVLATFPSADGALRATGAIRARLAADDLIVRAAVHVGDVERGADDLAGIAVHVAARVIALAGPGEVLATASVPIAATGSSHQFEFVGERALKGVPGIWAVFRAVTTDDPR